MRTLIILIISTLAIPVTQGFVVFTALNDAPAVSPGFGNEWDANGVSDPDPFWDGEIMRLYYTATGADSVQRIALATSTDLIAWTFRGIAWEPQGDGAFDDGSVYGPSVVHNGSQFELYYTGCSGVCRPHIGKVVSDDGTNYYRTAEFSDPLLGPSDEDGLFDAIGVGHPSVVYDNGYYLMMYQGFDGTVWKRLGAAQSEDGLVFQPIYGDAGKGAVFGLGPHGFDDAGALEPEITLVEGDIRLFYTSLHY